MIEFKQLESGIRLVYEKLPEYQSACLGVWVGAGSARETDDIAGISHYIEHMFFKGTKTRTALQIAKDTDDLGASVNAFTGKEATCYHIKALTEVFPAAVDVLFDMLRNSLFDEKEMRRELGVILEEMSMYEDTPDDIIIDYLTDRVLYGTPLQRPVIGSRKALRSIRRENILEYIKTLYTRDNIVVAVVGNFDERDLEERIERSFRGLRAKSPVKNITPPEGGPRFFNKTRDIGQSHIALGLPTVDQRSDDFYTQAIVNDYLGGSMSSKLFQNIREKRGLSYSVYSAPTSYASAGMLYIYAGVALGKEKEAVDAIRFELEDLGEKSIPEDQIQVIKQRLKSGYIFAQESLNNRMSIIGKNRLLLGRNYTQEETMAEVDAVSPAQVAAFCERLADIRKYSGVVISKNKLDIRKLIG
jgi:predicted Zn-dependent peptidase